MSKVVKVASVTTEVLYIFGGQTMWWEQIVTWLCTNGYYCGGGGGGGSGNSVPELSVTAGPIAVAVIVGILAIGLERRRRRKHQNEN